MFPGLHGIGSQLASNYAAWGQRRKAELSADPQLSPEAVSEECGKVDARVKKLRDQLSYVEDLKSAAAASSRTAAVPAAAATASGAAKELSAMSLALNVPASDFVSIGQALEKIDSWDLDVLEYSSNQLIQVRSALAFLQKRIINIEFSVRSIISLVLVSATLYIGGARHLLQMRLHRAHRVQWVHWIVFSPSGSPSFGRCKIYLLLFC